MNVNLDQLQKEASELLKSGKQSEDILRFLRERGCSKTLTIVVLPSIFGCDSREAKRIVHFSETWADTKESDEQFHENVERAVLQDKPKPENLC